MSVPGDGGDPPRRALLVALAAMAGVALFVGLAVAAAAMTVVQITGLGSTSGSTASRPSLYLPKYQPTRTPVYGSPAPSPSASSTRRPTAKPRTSQIKLFAAPQRVAAGQRINLNGVYVNGEGVALRIQQKDPGGQWTDFPVQVMVQGGAFDTWISTSHTGRTEFRVYDQQANRASNPVTVTVG